MSYWKDDEGDDARIFLSNHDLKLVALNARTGARYPDFGENGYIDLTKGYDREIDASRMTYSSPVAVAGDTIITGSIIQDTNIRLREASPGDVRAYDARTGDEVDLPHYPARGRVRRRLMAERVVALQRA